MGFFRNFGGKFKKNVMDDVEHLKGEGAIDKADMAYERIKAVFSGTWNLVIDKIIALLLKSAGKDLRILVREAKAAGKDPFTYFPDNVRDKLKKSYA